MNAFRLFLRTATRTIRVQPVKSFRSRQTPLFQQKRFASWQNDQYQRLGQQAQGAGKEQQQRRQWSRFGPMYRAQLLWENYRKPLLVVSGGGGIFYVSNLEDVPITHRRRFNFLSPEMELQIAGGDAAYNAILQEEKAKILPANHPYTQRVAKVISRLLPSTEGLAGDQWQVHVINDPKEKNAFVLPGGKVFVYTGILDICQDEGGLAAVLGHEIAHNVAHHVAEKASRGILITLGTMLFAVILGDDGRISRSLMDLVLSLPNSRTQEAEADHIGLLMMAQSCYDPEDALRFWERMQAAEKNQPPQFLSTHPTHYNRIDHIKQWLPEAKRVSEEHGCNHMRRLNNDFQDAVGTVQL